MKKKLFVLFVLIVSSQLIISQSFKKLYKESFHFLEVNDYEHALPLLMKMHEMKPDNANTNFSIGNCLMNLSHREHEAIPYYEIAMEGLTIGYGQGDVEQTTGTASDESTLFATYAIGGATVGIQKSERDNENASDVESTGIGISYQVNDDLSISYGAHELEAVGTTNPDQETAALGVAYTMGSLAISASMHDGDNITNSATDANQREKYSLGLTFNF